MSTTSLHAIGQQTNTDSASRLAVFDRGTNRGSLGAAYCPLRPGPCSLLDWRHEIHRLRGRGDFWFCLQQSADELGLLGVQRSKFLSLAGSYGNRHRPAHRSSAVLGPRRLRRQRVGRRHVLDHVELPPHDAGRVGGIGWRIPGAVRGPRTVPRQRLCVVRRIPAAVRRRLAGRNRQPDLRNYQSSRQPYCKSNSKRRLP